MATRSYEVMVENDSSKTAALVEECSRLIDSNEVDEIVLKAPLKHATRAVAICEQIKRRYANLATQSELKDIFNGNTGNERRKSTFLEIRITSQNTVVPH